MLRKSACGMKRKVFGADCAQPGGDARARARVRAGAPARSILTKQFIRFPARTLFVPANLRDPYLASQRKSGTIDLSLASPRVWRRTRREERWLARSMSRIPRP